MGGKASLFLVGGFSLIILVFTMNINKMSTSSVDNFSNYYNGTMAHNIAVSAANLASSELFRSSSWHSGYSDVDFSGGKINVSVVTIDADEDIKQITATGTFNGVSKTVRVRLKPSQYSKFAYFSTDEPSNVYWTTGDTVWGPLHLQDYLRVSNSPVFMGKVTTKKRIVYYHGKDYDTPKFYGGFEKGVDMDFPDDKIQNYETMADTGGHKFAGHDTVYMQMKADSMTYKYAWNGADTTVYLPTFAPNGLICVEDGNIRIKGVVQGQYSVIASGPTPLGSIWIDDDLTYYNDPASNPNSTDMLGLMARNWVLVADNPANNTDVEINAAIFCEKEGFMAENYASRPVAGQIKLLGGISQKKRQYVGTFNPWTGSMVSGFNKRYVYDERLMLIGPPKFPGTDSYEIISWYE